MLAEKHLFNLCLQLFDAADGDEIHRYTCNADLDKWTSESDTEISIYLNKKYHFKVYSTPEGYEYFDEFDGFEKGNYSLLITQELNRLGFNIPEQPQECYKFRRGLKPTTPRAIPNPQSLIPNKMKYFIHVDPHQFAIANKLDEAIRKMIAEYDGMLLPSQDARDLTIKEIAARMDALHSEHPRCKKISFSQFSSTLNRESPDRQTLQCHPSFKLTFYPVLKDRSESSMWSVEIQKSEPRLYEIPETHS